MSLAWIAYYVVPWVVLGLLVYDRWQVGRE